MAVPAAADAGELRESRLSYGLDFGPGLIRRAAGTLPGPASQRDIWFPQGTTAPQLWSVASSNVFHQNQLLAALSFGLTGGSRDSCRCALAMWLTPRVGVAGWRRCIGKPAQVEGKADWRHGAH